MGRPIDMGADGAGSIWPGALFVLTCLSSISPVRCAPDAASQMQLLLDFQQAWGQTFAGWVAGGRCSSAAHVKCDAQGMVTSIDLDSRGLTGSISSTIGSMASLTDLDLYKNNLTGSIPAGITKLHKLCYLSLGRNALTGSIPATIGNMSSLTYLYLGYNGLTGSIPSTISSLISLTQLSVSWEWE
ncbi:hypothetical protein CLOM_g12317 [Closterium sp. NIES-68]|nr:hypothetical protein CLOM_g12317 [Closterium sp. NIES-68]GJP59521.1 hypothetical protein CLOP_g12426 [Closterium sp. NIES-67]